MNDCKLCGRNNCLVKDFNTNYSICNACGGSSKENDYEEINDFQKYFSQNDKVMELINMQEENSIPPKTIKQKSLNTSKKDLNLIETKINNKIEEFSKKNEFILINKRKSKSTNKKSIRFKKNKI